MYAQIYFLLKNNFFANKIIFTEFKFFRKEFINLNRKIYIFHNVHYLKKHCTYINHPQYLFDRKLLSEYLIQIKFIKQNI